MKIAICDDCPEDAKALAGIVRQFHLAGNWDITVYASGTEFLDQIRKHVPFDLVLLDIDMPDLDGIALGKSVKAFLPNAMIIFATSHPQYMLDAFDLEAFHYILKPFDASKILPILRRACDKYTSANQYHCIKIKTQVLRIKISEIYFIEHCRKHVIYHTRDKDYETIETLGDVYASLKDFGFYQIHQGYLVNLEKVDHFDGYSVRLTDGRSVAVSVRKKSEVIAAYTKYIRGY